METQTVYGLQARKRAYRESSILYRAAFASLFVALVPTTQALALPSGANVAAGNVTITQPTGSDLVVNQTSNKAIINWQNFDILNGESTRFNQPGSNSVALNRVGSGSPTQILGKLSANGKLVIVNPNGVFFGATSQVDVAGLVATTADISNQDFLNGSTHFNLPGRPDASIINKGRITAAEGGLVALVAPGVRNDGVIQARAGTVQLASAQTMTVDFYGDGLFSFAVGEKTTQKAKDENGNTLNAAVENNGVISAAGGTIMLTANAAKEIVTNAVNNTGVVEAKAARIEGGMIVFDGGEGHVKLAGSIDASGKGAGQKGGKVTATGGSVQLANAQIDASGDVAGGEVRIGGDYQGGGNLARANLTVVDADSSIDVSAHTQGDAGLAVVWSDNGTQFDGNILATGGALGGNGGVVETSGGVLAVTGNVDASAVAGDAGRWLLDPRNITIRNALGNFRISCSGGDCVSTGNSAVVATWVLELALNLGIDVEIATGASGAQAGNITVQDSVDWLGLGSLSLIAHNDIILDDNIDALLGDVSLNAGRHIAFNNASIHLGAGDATLNGVNVSLNGNSHITAFNGAITINNSGTFFSNTANSLNAANGISLHQHVGGSIQNAVDAVGNTGSAGAHLILGAGTFDEYFTIDQANFNVTGQGQGVTVIQPTAVGADAAIILANAADSTALTPINFSGFSVDGTLLGVPYSGIVYDAATGSVQNVTLIGNVSGNHGILFSNAADASASNNNVSGFNSGISVIDSSNILLSGNVLNGNVTGIFVDPSSGIVVSGNNISGGVTGVHVLDSDGSDVNNNVISGQSGDGVLVENSDTTNVASNTISNVGGAAVHALDSDGVIISSNIVSDVNVGVHLERSNNAQLQAGSIYNAQRGVVLDRSTDAYIQDLSIAHHLNFPQATGIEASRSHRLTLDHVNINTRNNAVTLNRSRNVHVVNDASVISRSGHGIDAFRSNRLLVDNSDIQGGGQGHGIFLDNSNNVRVTNRALVIGDADGIHAINTSDNLIVEQSTVRGNDQGIFLDNSQNALVTASRVTANDGGVAAVQAVNGSHGLTVADSFIVSVTSGVVVDGSNNTVVQGTQIDATRGDGIAVNNALNTAITDNIITTGNALETGNDGIYITNSDGNVITGNDIDADHNGITLIDSDPIISGNTITAVNDGVFADNADDLVITNNGIFAGNDAVNASNGNNLLVANNGLFAGHDGVSITNQTGDTEVSVNFIRAARDGVNIDNTGGVDVIGNNIRAFRDGVNADNASGLNVEGNFIRASDDGVDVEDSNGVDVADNTIFSGRDGVNADNTDGLDVTDNTIFAARDGVNVEDSGFFGVSDNGINAGRDGVSVDGAGFFSVNGNDIFAFRDGVSVDNASFYNVSTNDIFAFRDGIHLDDSFLVSAIGNDIFAFRDGIYVTDSNAGTFLGNDIDNVGRDGIHLHNTNNSIIAVNDIDNAGRDGVRVSDGGDITIRFNTVDDSGVNGIHVFNGSDDVLVFRNDTANNTQGINAHDSNDVRVRFNTLNDDGLGIRFNNVADGVIANNTLTSTGAGVTAVSVTDSPFVEVTENNVTDYFDGIGVITSNNALVADNTVAGPTGLGTGFAVIDSDDVTFTGNSAFNKNVGFFIDPLSGLFFDGNTADGNIIGAEFVDVSNSTISNNFFTNNEVAGLAGSQLDNVTITGNVFSGNGDGAVIHAISNSDISGNQFVSNLGIGLDVDLINNLTVNGNDFDSNTVGAFLSNATGLALNNNNFLTNSLIGVALFDSTDAVFTGDIFTGNVLGIQLNNSTGTRLQEETITTAAGGTGIQIENGSGGTIVRNLTISGGDVGILLDGLGSSMQFEDINSQFAGDIGFYFVLQNNAMQGEVLDASQQFFAGTRADDFTFAQLQAAEAKVIDDESTLTVGDVFFKEFPIDTNEEEAERARRDLFRRGLFSYAGRTLNNNIEETSFSFEVGKLDLSLLNRTPLPAATPAGIANFFATLAPAAGGNNVPANAAPGSFAAQFAELNPAAGGCGNNYLDGGFALGFNAGTCSVQ